MGSFGHNQPPLRARRNPFDRDLYKGFRLTDQR